MSAMWTRKHSKKQDLRLHCQWESCTTVFTDMHDFYVHLETHVGDQQPNNTESQLDLHCRWKHCNCVSDSFLHFRRHIFFHGFHSKAKFLGTQIYQKNKLPPCQFPENFNSIPDIPEGFQCCWEDCYVIFDVPDQFYFHVGEHALMTELETISDTKKGYKCRWEGCEYFNEYNESNKRPKSQYHGKLKHHMTRHTQERQFACAHCGTLYTNGTKLVDHYSRQADTKNHNFRCTYCEKTYASERLLKDHMRHHVNPYKCPNCEMTCPNPSALKHHIRYKHSDERPYPCEFCDYRSKEPYDLQVHMGFHQSSYSFYCQVDGCDYSVRSIQNLQTHYRSKHGNGDAKVYMCHICDKQHTFGYQLTHHLRKVHKFELPPGHSRFRYKQDHDGYFRLQLYRYETAELCKDFRVSVDSNSKTSPMKATKPSKPRKSKRNSAVPQVNTKQGAKMTKVNTKMKTTQRGTKNSPAKLANLSKLHMSPKLMSKKLLDESRKSLPRKNLTDEKLAADALCSMQNVTSKSPLSNISKRQENMQTASTSSKASDTSYPPPSNSPVGTPRSVSRLRKLRKRQGSARKRLLLDTVTAPSASKASSLSSPAKKKKKTSKSIAPVFQNMHSQMIDIGGSGSLLTKNNKVPIVEKSSPSKKALRLEFC